MRQSRRSASGPGHPVAPASPDWALSSRPGPPVPRSRSLAGRTEHPAPIPAACVLTRGGLRGWGGAGRGGGDRAEPQEPLRAVRRADASGERGGPASAPPAPGLTGPPPPPPSARQHRRLRRAAPRRPGPARPPGRCPELPLSPPPTRLVAVWEVGAWPGAAERDRRGRGGRGAVGAARGPCIS